jgi:predicted  nucleic acid-binding Zn-ribbon protein
MRRRSLKMPLRVQRNILKLIENLRKDFDKSSKAVDDLRVSNAGLSTRNSDLAKALSSKEQQIQDLEKVSSEQSQISGHVVNDIKEKLKLFFEEYRKALRDFGVHPGPLPENEEISDLMN